MPGMGLGTRSYPPVRGAHRPDLLRIRPLESRRLGNLHVRFGGGRMEKGVCDVPRRPPTRLRKGSEPPNGGGGEEPGASAPGTVPAPLSPWESPAGATGVTVAPAGLLGREGGLGSPRSTRGCRPWLLTAAPPQLWEQTLSQDPFDDLAGDVGEAVVAPLVLVGQPLVVDAQEMEDCGVEVVDVDAVGRDAVAEGIRRAKGDARLDPATGRPDGEASGVVVAAVVGGRQLALAVIRPAELAAPEHQRVVEQAALLQVDDQRRAGLVGLAAEGADAAGQAAVVVPAGVIELDEPDVALGQPAGQQAVGGERARLARIRAV